MIEITVEVGTTELLEKLKEINATSMNLEELEKIVLENLKVRLLDSIPKFHDTRGCNGKSIEELFGGRCK